MQKGITYHKLLSDFVEASGICDRHGCLEDLDSDRPACVDIWLAQAVCHPLPNGEWSVDLIVKPEPGNFSFRRLHLRRCRNQKEAEILAAYSRKVMQAVEQEEEEPFPFN